MEQERLQRGPPSQVIIYMSTCTSSQAWGENSISVYPATFSNHDLLSLHLVMLSNKKYGLEVPALLDQVPDQQPLINYVTKEFQEIGYGSWAHRVLNTAGKTEKQTAVENWIITKGLVNLKRLRIRDLKGEICVDVLCHSKEVLFVLRQVSASSPSHETQITWSSNFEIRLRRSLNTNNWHLSPLWHTFKLKSPSNQWSTIYIEKSDHDGCCFCEIP